MRQKRIYATFYRTASGKEPVREWLLGLSREDRQLIGVAIKDTEFAWPIGMPLCRSIKGQSGLREVRCDMTGNRIARVMFYVTGDEMILLHGFVKKTQKTEPKDIDLAVKRKKEHERGEN